MQCAPNTPHLRIQDHLYLIFIYCQTNKWNIAYTRWRLWRWSVVCHSSRAKIELLTQNWLKTVFQTHLKITTKKNSFQTNGIRFIDVGDRSWWQTIHIDDIFVSDLLERLPISCCRFFTSKKSSTRSNEVFVQRIL